MSRAMSLSGARASTAGMPGRWHSVDRLSESLTKPFFRQDETVLTECCQLAKLSRMKVIDAKPDEDAPYTLISRKFALPARFTATVELDDPALPLCHLEAVVEGGRAVCEAVRLERRRGGPPVNGTVLRQIPIGECAKRAASKLAALAVRSSSGRLSFTDPETGEATPVYTKPIDDEHLAVPVVTGAPKFLAAYEGGRAGRVSEDELREAADAYREAFATAEGGERAAPTVAVAKRLNVSRSTAARRVAAARAAGFLGDALRGRGGER